MKKILSALLSISMSLGAIAAFPVNAATELMHATFESGLDGWTARGSGCQVAVESGMAASGSQCAAVTNRGDSWNGIAYKLDSATFPAGKTISVSAQVKQTSTPQPVEFKMTIEYTSGGGGMGMGGGSTYDTFATVSPMSGGWGTLSKDGYVIGEGASVLYIETEESKCDFYVDEIIIVEGSGGTGTVIDDPPSGKYQKGDADHSGKVNADDAYALRDFLICKSAAVYKDTADMDGDGSLNAIDLALLKALILNPPETTTTTTTTTETVTTTSGGGGGKTNAKEYMAKISPTLTKNVPQNVKSGDQGKTTHFEYMSKKAGHNKGANVWLPPGYTESKKYNVLYMSHGIFGDENGMLEKSWAVREMASNMIQSGEAEPFIIIFTQMYTDPGTMGAPGFNINMNVMDKYDDFVFDLRDSLMPYVQEHWSVMTGREHTAVAGFSMGGRESLYVGMMLPDLIGYVCASSPAPGIVPASDAFLSNHLGSYNLARTARLKEGDFKYSDSDLPYVLLIGGGTNDGTVGTFPKQYHELYDKNGTTNLWMEFQNAGHDASVGCPLFYNFYKWIFKA